MPNKDSVVTGIAVQPVTKNLEKTNSLYRVNALTGRQLANCVRKAIRVNDTIRCTASDESFVLTTGTMKDLAIDIAYGETPYLISKVLKRSVFNDDFTLSIQKGESSILIYEHREDGSEYAPDTLADYLTE